MFVSDALSPSKANDDEKGGAARIINNNTEEKEYEYVFDDEWILPEHSQGNYQ